MKKLLLLLMISCLAGTALIAQAEKKQPDKSINHEWRQATDQVERALKDIEIPDIDIDRIMDDVRDAMPNQAEMEGFKSTVRDAIRDLEKIDFSKLEQAIDDLELQLSDIFGNDAQKHSKQKDSKDRKI